MTMQQFRYAATTGALVAPYWNPELLGRAYFTPSGDTRVEYLDAAAGIAANGVADARVDPGTYNLVK